jgi:dihydrofolate reductase
MIVSAIAAMARNRVIGREGGLPWSLPEDMKFFRTQTQGHIMIMGRKTFESLGKPLPKRFHIVVTRDTNYRPPAGVVVAHTAEEALSVARALIAREPVWGDEVFVIGGGEIYNLFLNHTNRIYLTEISEEFSGDAKFPEFTPKQFRETQRQPRPGPPPFDFVVYERS